MSVPFDSRRAPRSPEHQLALVRSVRDRFIADETDWLEWKCEPELTKNAIAKTAKAILAFANRDPRAAMHHVGGVGLFLLGVEPDSVPGLAGPRLDQADLHNKIVPLCGNTIQWTANYLEFEQSTVLIVTVDPPQPGDPPYPARKTYGADASGKPILKDGMIYVRRGTKSEPARADQIDVLLARHSAGQRTDAEALEVELDHLAQSRAAVDLRNPALDLAARKVVSELPPPRRKPEHRLPNRDNSDLARRLGLQFSSSQSLFAQKLAELQDLSYSTLASRTPIDEAAETRYGEKLIEHKKRVRSALPEHLRATAIARQVAPLTLTLTNPTESTVAGIEITLELDLPVAVGTVAVDPSDAKPAIPPLPNPPRPPGLEYLGSHLDRNYGLARFADLTARLPKPFLPEISRVGDQVTVTFPERELRALQTKQQLPALFLAICDPSVTAIAARWTATAKHLRGRLSGTLTIAIDGAVIPADELVEPTEPLGTS